MLRGRRNLLRLKVGVARARKLHGGRPAGVRIRVSAICPGSGYRFFTAEEEECEKMLQPADIAHAVETIVTQAPQSFISEILMRPTQKP